MRNRLLIGLLFFSLFGWGQVPDTNTFTLDTVVKVVNPATNDLSACFSAAVKANFDPLYDSIGYAPVNSLLRFRNYQASEAPCDTCYGLLYNWYAVNTGKLAPTGWHVPTDAEWTTLTTWLTDNGYGYQGSGDDIAKSAASQCGWDVWDSGYGNPGSDSYTNNSSGLSIFPAGFRIYAQSGIFGGVGQRWYQWSSTQYSSSNAWLRYQYVDNIVISRYNLSKRYGCSVRCVRDIYEGWEEDVPVVDYDGNEYDVVKIGTQLWLVQNLVTTHLNDGTAIPEVTDNSEWSILTTPAFCAYDNDWSNACKTRPDVME